MVCGHRWGSRFGGSWRAVRPSGRVFGAHPPTPALTATIGRLDVDGSGGPARDDEASRPGRVARACSTFGASARSWPCHPVWRRRGGGSASTSSVMRATRIHGVGRRSPTTGSSRRSLSSDAARQSSARAGSSQAERRTLIAPRVGVPMCFRVLSAPRYATNTACGRWRISHVSSPGPGRREWRL